MHKFVMWDVSLSLWGKTIIMKWHFWNELSVLMVTFASYMQWLTE